MLVNFFKNIIWDLERDFTECVDQFGSIAVLTKLSLLIHEYRVLTIYFSLFKILCIFYSF